MNSNLEAQLTELIQNELVKRNCELFSLRVYRAGNRQVISLAIDHSTGGITLDECVGWNHWVSEQIEEKNLVPTAYVVEVQSPGLDWPLQSERDFRRVIGKRVRVEFGGSETGVRTRVGRVMNVKDGVLSVRVSEAEPVVEVPLSSILKARVEIPMDIK